MTYDERTWTSPIDKIIDATMDAWSDALGEHLVRGNTGMVFESGDFPPDAHFAFEAAIRTATEAWETINGKEAN
tara:strand:+ start:218 stop:439 length:222 start_codon:yes stop_codon:yes gene_type:complete